MLYISLVSCPSLSNPSNGMIDCSLGDDGALSYEDTCSFTCNTGYELTGSDTRTCQSDGSWSGSQVSCFIMKCPISSLPIDSILPESCDNTYQSMCELQCPEGFNGTGSAMYMCDIINGSSIMWIPLGDVWTCEGGCLLIIHLLELHNNLFALILICRVVYLFAELYIYNVST